MSGFGTIAGNIATRSGDIVGICGDKQLLFDQDRVTQAQSSIGHPHEEIHEGNGYIVTDTAPSVGVTLTSGGFLRYLVQTSSKIDHMLFGLVANVGVITKIWENPTVGSAGIALTTINHSRVSGITSVTTVLISGVITSGTGTLLEITQIGAPTTGAGGNFNAGFGGSTSSDRNENEYNLKISGSYLVETLVLGSGAVVNSQFRWYEE